MLKKIAVATAAAALGATLVAAPATAAPANPGAACVQSGIGFLKGDDGALLRAAAQKQIDYSTLADPVNGPIFTSLEPESNLSLGQVVKLHTKAPSVFAWCR
ncbi:MAG: hypothetical protein H5T83_05150 [Actinotalea sp.]|nr:hypothetical protein [Actinotalea sp.]